MAGRVCVRQMTGSCFEGDVDDDAEDEDETTDDAVEEAEEGAGEGAGLVLVLDEAAAPFASVTMDGTATPGGSKK